MQNLDKGLLNTITQRLVNQFHPDAIAVFGSHAWGTPTPNSDLDLMVIVPQSTLSPAKRAYEAYKSLQEIPIPLDIVVKTKSEFNKFRGVYASLEAQVAEKGIVLHGHL
jgi:predicted nucleotidyltransferase